MDKSQKGFTLIELAIVIVILGILAAMAVPKFLDMRTSAAQSATDAVAGAITTGFANNYAAVLAQNAGSIDIAVFPSAGGVLALVNSILANGTSQITAYTANMTSGVSAVTVSCAAGDTATLLVSRASPAASATATLICTS